MARAGGRAQVHANLYCAGLRGISSLRDGPAFSPLSPFNWPVESCESLGGGHDVLVEAEEVVRIVLLFELAQPLVVSAVGGAHGGRPVVAEIVDVSVGS